MSNKEFHPADNERRKRVVEIVVTTIGATGAAQLLLDGAPERGAEPIRAEDIRKFLEGAIEDENVSSNTILTAVRRTDAIHALENFVLSAESSRISHRMEQGIPLPKATEDAMEGLPGWLAEDLLYQQFDEVEARMFAGPGDWESLLGLQQIEAKWFGKDQNRQERKQTWDKMLAFSLYRVEVVLEDQTKATRQFWAHNSAKAHNEQLRRTKKNAEVKGNPEPQVETVETMVEKLFSSDYDPLSDLEAFVGRWE